MGRAYILENGMVANVAVVGGEIPAGYTACADDVQIGWPVVDGTPAAPPDPEPVAEVIPVPDRVELGRLVEVLVGMGLGSAYAAAVGSLTGDTAIIVQAASSIPRGHALTTMLSAALELTEDEVDDIFRASVS